MFKIKWFDYRRQAVKLKRTLYNTALSNTVQRAAEQFVSETATYRSQYLKSRALGSRDIGTDKLPHIIQTAQRASRSLHCGRARH